MIPHAALQKKPEERALSEFKAVIIYVCPERLTGR